MHNDVVLDTGSQVTRELVERVLAEELAKARELVTDDGDRLRLDQAVELFVQVALADDFVEFLTLPAYALID